MQLRSSFTPEPDFQRGERNQQPSVSAGGGLFGAGSGDRGGVVGTLPARPTFSFLLWRWQASGSLRPIFVRRPTRSIRLNSESSLWAFLVVLSTAYVNWSVPI